MIHASNEVIEGNAVIWYDTDDVVIFNHLVQTGTGFALPAALFFEFDIQVSLLGN